MLWPGWHKFTIGSIIQVSFQLSYFFCIQLTHCKVLYLYFKLLLFPVNHFSEKSVTIFFLFNLIEKLTAGFRYSCRGLQTTNPISFPVGFRKRQMLAYSLKFVCGRRLMCWPEREKTKKRAFPQQEGERKFIHLSKASYQTRSFLIQIS